MKNWIKNILRITLPSLIIIFIILEILSRLFFPGAQNPSAFFDHENRMVKYSDENGKTGTYTIGKFSQQRGRWRINNDGWNSPFDYFIGKGKKKIRIAVIGDSYIESFQVDIDKSYPSLLKNKLGDNYDVYSFGVSGAPLSQYLHISRYVNKKYNPDIFIFNIIHNDGAESIAGLYSRKECFLTFNLKSHKITEILPIYLERGYKKIPFGKLLKKSSFLRYLYGNLKINQLFRTRKNDNKEINANIVVDEVYRIKDYIKRVIIYFMDVITKELAGKRVIFVMDAPRNDIYSDNLDKSSILFLNRIMYEQCKKYGFEFLDLTGSINKDFKLRHIKFNSELDGHWNEYGHQFVSQQVLELLEKHKVVKH